LFNYCAKIIATAFLLLILACNNNSKSSNTLKKFNLPDTCIVTVRILNGCGVKGAAFKVRNILAPHKNIDILGVSNTLNQNFSKTLIAVRKANLLKQHFLMNYTKIDKRILSLNKKNTAEFDIILGKDYKKYFGSLNAPKAGGNK